MSEIVFGLHAVSQALSTGRGRLLILHGSNPRLEPLRLEAERQGIAHRPAGRNELEKRCAGTHHQGAALEVAPFRYAQLDSLLDEPGPIIALDGVEDPGNLGAIIRSTYALGGAGVLIPKRGAAPVTPACERAASGAASLLPIVCVTNLARSLEELKKAGRWVFAADMDGKGPLETYDLTEPLVLVLGSEGKGLRPGVLKRCDGIFQLPMVRSFESLNVSVSAALCLDAVRRAQV
jgi:23S rRNA (guanosine2251-2'-O)-methyltransferase